MNLLWLILNVLLFWFSFTNLLQFGAQGFAIFCWQSDYNKHLFIKAEFPVYITKHVIPGKEDAGGGTEKPYE